MPITSIDPTADMLTARDRARRARDRALSPAERLAAMRQLIERSWGALERHPEGRAHFLRRNFRARAVTRHVDGPPDGA
jgi:hypothetical protein